MLAVRTPLQHQALTLEFQTSLDDISVQPTTRLLPSSATQNAVQLSSSFIKGSYLLRTETRISYFGRNLWIVLGHTLSLWTGKKSQNAARKWLVLGAWPVRVVALR
uniref:Uncharacterized protein n=1 Tax=Timema cristinae TaxID=61476 RepID=A0A7R9DRF1_TIMCR|nr:unnamed protein product [Timema cristinae]